MSDMSTDDRLAALESRLRDLEDEREISQLVASYGPLVDAGDADSVAGLWTEDGVYDVDEFLMGDPAAIRAMVLSDDHQTLIARGCSHFLGPARVSIDGDTAVAVCHSILVVHHEGRFFPVRSGANHFTLVRTEGGWRISNRTSRLLNGNEEAPALLGDGAAGRSAPTGR